jgi:hypothetical protein
VRRSRQALIALAVAGCAGAACLVLIFILASRDSSDVSSGAAGPGVQQPDHGRRHTAAAAPASPPADPPTSGPHRVTAVTRDRVALSDDQLLSALELGNVVIAYDTPRPSAALVALQRDAAGPFSADLAAAGQAVILDHRPGAGGTLALAWRRLLRSSDLAQLRDFADTWLGQGP